jgi:hypothetical protein
VSLLKCCRRVDILPSYGLNLVTFDELYKDPLAGLQFIFISFLVLQISAQIKTLFENLDGR